MCLLCIIIISIPGPKEIWRGDKQNAAPTEDQRSVHTDSAAPDTKLPGGGQKAAPADPQAGDGERGLQ